MEQRQLRLLGTPIPTGCSLHSGVHSWVRLCTPHHRAKWTCSCTPAANPVAGSRPENKTNRTQTCTIFVLALPGRPTCPPAPPAHPACHAPPPLPRPPGRPARPRSPAACPPMQPCLGGPAGPSAVRAGAGPVPARAGGPAQGPAQVLVGRERTVQMPPPPRHRPCRRRCRRRRARLCRLASSPACAWGIVHRQTRAQDPSISERRQADKHEAEIDRQQS